MKKKLIIIGASGHGKVVADIAIENGYRVLGFLDDDESKHENYGFPVLGRIDDAVQFEGCEFIIAIGKNEIRKKIAEKYKNFNYATLIHPKAVVSASVQIGAGTVIMPMAVINAEARIGNHCIINSSSVIEHDCRIEDYVHISPGVALCGTVSVGQGTWIGAGVTVINNISICNECVIGAGGVVTKNISDSGIYVGVPIRRI